MGAQASLRLGNTLPDRFPPKALDVPTILRLPLRTPRPPKSQDGSRGLGNTMWGSVREIVIAYIAGAFEFIGLLAWLLAELGDNQPAL